MSIANPNLHHDNPEKRAADKLKRTSSVASFSVATLLVIFKFTAFLSTNSVSLLSSLMDSAFDAVASLLILVSIIHAASPADEDHRFGHSKIEALGALAQSLFILGSALLLLIESLRRLAHPQEIHDPAKGIGVMLLSIVMTAALIAYQRYVIRKTHSLAVRADYAHYAADVMVNVSVLASMAASYWTKSPYVDSVFAILVSLKLLHGAYKISLTSFDVLLDREIPDTERQKIIDLILSHKEVRGIHDLRTRHTSERHIISFHIELDPAKSLSAVHDVMDELENMIFNAFPRSEVLIHPEPAGIDDHRIDKILRR